MERVKNYDVVVLGGGSAGIAAGVAAAECGAKTIIIERQASFGGQSTNSGVTTYCGFYTRGEKPSLVVHGIGKKVLDGLRAMGGNADYTISKATGNVTVRFDPELLKSVLDDLLVSSKADYLLHAYAYDAEREGDQIKAIHCADDAGHFTVNGKVFIDASGDANLCNLAGIETTWGDENGKTQLASLPVRFENLPVNKEFMPSEMEHAISEGREDGFLPMDQDTGLILKVPSDTYGYCTIPSCIVPSLDAETLTKAEMDLRKQGRNYMRSFAKYVPGLENIYISQSGPSIGIRESRRIIGEEKLTGKEMLAGTKRKDTIGRGGWSPDIHVSNEELVYLHMADNDYYDIPLGCLKVAKMDNVWACGRIVSSDSIAHASLRVMGTGFVTGQAAGVAAALQAICGTREVADVQAELVKQGALL